MIDLGILACHEGRLEQAERWHRAAADAGHPGAACNLSTLLRDTARRR